MTNALAQLAVGCLLGCGLIGAHAAMRAFPGSAAVSSRRAYRPSIAVALVNGYVAMAGAVALRAPAMQVTAWGMTGVIASLAAAIGARRLGGAGPVTAVAVAATCLATFGWVTTASLGAPGDARWLGLAIGAFIAGAWCGRRLTVSAPVAAIGLAVTSVELLAALFVVGNVVHGARVSLPLPAGQAWQPAELARLGAVAAVAVLTAHRVHEIRAGAWRPAAVAATPAVVVAGLLVAANDLGPALVTLSATVLVLVVAGMRWRYLASCVAALAACAVPLVMTAGHIAARLSQWTTPVLADGRPRATGLAFRAIAQGGLTGRGVGHARGLSLANTPQDFVLVGIAHDRGAFGVLVTLLLVTVLSVGLWRCAYLAPTGSSRLVATALAAVVTSQALWVSLASFGVLPVTGLSLPLVSSGGSGLVATALALGTVVGLHGRAEPATRPDRRHRVAVRAFQLAWVAPATAAVTAALASPVPQAIAGVPARERPTILAADGTRLAVTGRSGATRVYPLGPLFAEIVGYSSAAGRSAGLERGVEPLVDCARGRRGTACGASGLLTGLDVEVQRSARAALGTADGDVVVLDVTTGALVALYGRRGTYDPNRITSGSEALAYAAALDARRTGPSYPVAAGQTSSPGSTFKLVTAAAALAAGVDLEAPAGAVYRSAGGRNVHNAWNGPCDGGTLVRALATSCNTYFAAVGERIGSVRWTLTAHELGFDGRSWRGSMVPGAISGRVGDVTGDTVAVSAIGQLDVQATPLGMAVVTAAIARGGALVSPRTVLGFCRGDREIVLPGQPPVRVMPPGAAARIAAGMREAVADGTAAGFQALPFAVAAKTGTPQVGDGDRTDGWVVAYAPVDQPRFAIAVRVRGDAARPRRGGAGDAVPVARAVLAASMRTTARGLVCTKDGPVRDAR